MHDFGLLVDGATEEEAGLVVMFGEVEEDGPGFPDNLAIVVWIDDGWHTTVGIDG